MCRHGYPQHGYPQPENGTGSAGAHSDSIPPIRISATDLMPLVHARDAAQAKVAAIGGVNPRAGGLLNKMVQAVKKLISPIAPVVCARPDCISIAKDHHHAWKPPSKPLPIRTVPCWP